MTTAKQIVRALAAAHAPIDTEYDINPVEFEEE